MRTIAFIAAGLAMLLAAPASSVQAEDYPERPVRMSGAAACREAESAR